MTEQTSPAENIGSASRRMAQDRRTGSGEPHHNHAFLPLMRIFLLDARFNLMPLCINFVLPLVILVGGNWRCLFDARVESIPTSGLMDGVVPFIVFNLLSTALNLVIAQIVQLREEGVLAGLAHAAGSPVPVLAAVWASQTLVAVAQSLALSLVAMILARRFLPMLILMVLVGGPCVMAVVTALFSPLLCLAIPARAFAAVLTVLIAVLFALPSTGGNAIASTMLALNPVVCSRTLLQFLVHPLGMVLPSADALTGLGLIILVSLIAVPLSLCLLTLRPIVRRI